MVRPLNRGPRAGSAPAVAADPAFVGRDDVLTEVANAIADGPALIVVEGEPGIGKTRLVHEVLRSEPVSTRRVLQVACPPLRDPFPLGPVVDGLRRFRNQLPDGELGAIGLSGLGGALRPVFPEWVDELPSAVEPLDDPRERRHRLLRALTELVERFGVEVLVVEDVHWSDTATLEWLLSLVSAADCAMSIVVTYRPADVGPGSLLVGLTSRIPRAMAWLRVELGPLDVTQTGRLAGSMLHTEQMSAAFATFLHQHTDGIPLAIEECVRLLRDRHDIVRRHGEWTRRVLDELAVPPTVRDSVLERVARMPPAAGGILEAAAVLAEPAGERLLNAVAGLDEQSGDIGVESALAAGLLRETRPGLYAFRHVLDALAVLEVIPASRLRGLHRRAARALRGIDPEPVVRLARHYREVGDDENWCRYGEASADLALKSGDDRAAVATLLEIVSSVAHPIDRWVRLARKLAEAWHFSAEDLSEFVEPLVEALRQVIASDECVPGQRGEMWLHLGRALWSARQERAALAAFEAAVPDLRHRPDLALNAMTNLAAPLTPDWPAARTLYWLDRASELAGEVDSAQAQLGLRGVRAAALLLVGEEAGWESFDVSIDSSTSRARRRSVVAHTMDIAQATIVWGRYDDSYRRLRQAAECTEAANHSRELNRLRVIRAYLDWYTGRWSGLPDNASELMAVDDDGGFIRLSGHLLAGQFDLATGARAAAEAHLREVIDGTASYEGVYPDFIGAQASMARLRLAADAPAEALRLTAPVVEMIAGKGVWLWATDITAVHADALVATGHVDGVDDLVERLAAGLDGRDAPAPVAALTTCRAIAAEAHGRQDRAAALFAAAADAWAALPRPYDAHLARERYGGCLLAAGAEREALDVLSDAERRLRELGAMWDADRIARVLRERGVEVVRTWRRGPRGYGDQFSPRELAVVELAARGMTNKQIAETLFISPRTVGQHLSRAMRKLGVSSRTSLVMAAAKAELLTPEHGSEV